MLGRSGRSSDASEKGLKSVLEVEGSKGVEGLAYGAWTFRFLGLKRIKNAKPRVHGLVESVADEATMGQNHRALRSRIEGPSYSEWGLGGGCYSIVTLRKPREAYSTY